MAAATLTQIVAGIQVRLNTIAGLRAEKFAPDSALYPVAFVGVPEIPEYRTTFGRGRYSIEPTVTVLTSAAYNRIGQTALAEYADVVGAKSIPAAIEGDRTLGGIVDECFVHSFAPLGLEQMGALAAYGGVFNLRVTARGV